MSDLKSCACCGRGELVYRRQVGIVVSHRVFESADHPWPVRRFGATLDEKRVRPERVEHASTHPAAQGPDAAGVVARAGGVVTAHEMVTDAVPGPGVVGDDAIERGRGAEQAGD